MFNTAVGQLTVQFRNDAGGWRTAAQSVILPTRRLDLSTNSVDEEGDWSYQDDALEVERPINLSCDSVEISGAFKAKYGGQVPSLLAAAYQQGLGVYLQQYGRLFSTERRPVQGNGIIAGAMGQEEADAHSWGMSTLPNEFVETPCVAYSDMSGDTVISIPVRYSDDGSVTVVSGPDFSPYYPLDVPLTASDNRRFIYLRPEDSAAVYRLHSKGFADSPYVEEESAIVNTLVGQDIANRIKERPSLSIGLVRPNPTAGGREGESILAAYVLAYETTITDKIIDELGENVGQKGEKVIYLDEWVADSEKFKISAMTLMTEWLRIVEENYAQKGETIKIVTMARESTSLAVIKKILDRRGLSESLEDLGPVFQRDEDDNARILSITIGPEQTKRHYPLAGLVAA